jgi:hypothetical protein
MGRSITSTGRDRSRDRSRTGGTGKKQRRAGAGTGRTGESTGDTGQTGSTGRTGESTGDTGPAAAVVGIVATDHQIAPEQPIVLELLTQDTTAAPEPIPDNLAAEAAAALDQAPADPALAPEAPVDPPYDPDLVTEWDMYMKMAVDLIAKVALPQWNLSDDEKTELTKSTAHILQDLFPGGLSGRYAPYLRLITVTGFIVVTRHKEHGGKLPGLGPKPESKPDIVAQQ